MNERTRHNERPKPPPLQLLLLNLLDARRIIAPSSNLLAVTVIAPYSPLPTAVVFPRIARIAASGPGGTPRWNGYDMAVFSSDLGSTRQARDGLDHLSFELLGNDNVPALQVESLPNNRSSSCIKHFRLYDKVCPRRKIFRDTDLAQYFIERLGVSGKFEYNDLGIPVARAVTCAVMQQCRRTEK